MTTLYFEAPVPVILDIQRRGFAAVLGQGTALCRAASTSDVPPLPEVTEKFAEMKLDLSADVGGYECFPMDVPPGRWFRIPAAALDKMIAGS
jgi:hypothetical protein